MVGTAAFSAARYKIKSAFFQSLNALVVEHLQKLTPKTWNGFQLIAVDGSTVSIPPSPWIKAFFGVFAQTDKGTKTCMAQALICFDVLSNYVLSSIIGKMDTGEKSLLKTLLPQLKVTNAIFILDRGFGYFNVCKMLQNQQHKFCIRLSIHICSFAKKAMLNPENDFVTMWEPSETERSSCKKAGLDNIPVKVRVSKVILDTGEIELLVSNLFDLIIIDNAAMKKLYFMRWGIEENIKKLQPKMKLEHFGCRKPEGIYQEFYAHIFMLNIVALIGNEAQDKIDASMNQRKYAYKYNWQNAFLYVREKIVSLVNSKNLYKIINDLVQKIALSVVAVIENRKFAREKQSRQKPRLFQCYK